MTSQLNPRYAPRAQKASKILAVLQDFLGKELAGRDCLDVGCSNGLISRFLASQCRAVVGIDVNEAAIREAHNQGPRNLMFVVSDGQLMPFPNACFNLVICAQIYEHASDQEQLVTEIWRVLKPGGVCFFSGPNSLALMEEHYWLPFLSWLPRLLAGYYLRLFCRGHCYDVWPLNYWQLRRLWHPFILHDYTMAMIREPERFHLQDRVGRYAWIGRLPRIWLGLLRPFFPNYNWILVKPS
jgi:SAM-dependent methyltransferase